MVLNRASRKFVELHDPGTITPSVNIAKPVTWPYNPCCARCPGRAIVVGVAVKLLVFAVRLARRQRAGVRRRRRYRRRPRDRRRRRVLSRPAVSARQAPSAVARAPQADPLVHLHRLRARRSSSSRSSCWARCCCSSTSARTWCRPVQIARRSGAPRRDAAPRSRFSGTADAPGHARPDRKPACSRSFPASSIAVVPVDRACARKARLRSRGVSGRQTRELRVLGVARRPVDARRSAGVGPGVDRLRGIRGTAGVLRVSEPSGDVTEMFVRGVAFPDSSMPGYAVIVDLPDIS